MFKANGIAISYIRFSLPDQAQGHSLKRQRARCEEYCKGNDLRLLTDEQHTFFDRGVSGYDGANLDEDKGQLARLKKLLKGKVIKPGTTLVVESLDRISRQTIWEALPQFMDLLNSGLIIVTLTDKRVYQQGCSGIDLFASIMVMQRAHEESSTKSDRVRRARVDNQQAARDEYRPMGDVAPKWLRLKKGWKGYDADGIAYEENPERADVVRRIFREAVEGYGKGSIARRLNAEGIPPFKIDNEKLRAKGLSGWGPSSVDKVLKNRATVGEYLPHLVRTVGTKKVREPVKEGAIPGYYPVTVTESLFKQASSAIEGRLVAKATRQTEKFNIFQGLAKCIHCGIACHIVSKGKSPKGGTYLQCYRARQGNCEGKLMRLEPAEKMYELMLHRLPVMALVKDHSKQLESKLVEVEQSLAEQRRLKVKFAADYEKAPDLDMVLDAVRRNSALIADLEKSRKALKADLASEESLELAEFQRRLRLDTVPSRNAANTLLKRLKVLVHIGRDGCAVSKKGTVLFCLGYRVDKEAPEKGGAGFREMSPWPKHRQRADDPLHVAASKALAASAPLHFGLPLEAGSLAFAKEDEADQLRYDLTPDDGQPLSDAEAAVLGVDPQPLPEGSRVPAFEEVAQRAKGKAGAKKPGRK
jgi:DNA invertase Pin-like site-specific DNA recombinase